MRARRVAILLWLVLASVVFNVRFDWMSRTAGLAFVRAQLAHQRRGEPIPTIEQGFRPLIRQAAADSAVWLVGIAVTGTALTLAASRRNA